METSTLTATLELCARLSRELDELPKLRKEREVLEQLYEDHMSERANEIEQLNTALDILCWYILNDSKKTELAPGIVSSIELYAANRTLQQGFTVTSTSLARAGFFPAPDYF